MGVFVVFFYIVMALSATSFVHSVCWFESNYGAANDGISSFFLLIVPPT